MRAPRRQLYRLDRQPQPSSPPGKEHVKSSYTDGRPAINRNCLQTEEAQSHKQENLLGQRSNGQRVAADGGAGTPLAPVSCGLLRAEISARTVVAPATRTTGPLPLGTRRGRQPALSLVGAPPTRRSAARGLSAVGTAAPTLPSPHFANAACADWQSRQRCQDTLQQATGARSCYMGTAGAEMTEKNPGEQSRRHRNSRFKVNSHENPRYSTSSHRNMDSQRAIRYITAKNQPLLNTRVETLLFTPRYKPPGLAEPAGGRQRQRVQGTGSRSCSTAAPS